MRRATPPHLVVARRPSSTPSSSSPLRRRPDPDLGPHRRCSPDRLLVLLPTDFAGVATPRPASSTTILSVAGATSPDLPDSSSSPLCSTTGLGEPRPPLLLFPLQVTAPIVLPIAMLVVPRARTPAPAHALAVATCTAPLPQPTVSTADEPPSLAPRVLLPWPRLGRPLRSLSLRRAALLLLLRYGRRSPRVRAVRPPHRRAAAASPRLRSSSPAAGPSMWPRPATTPSPLQLRPLVAVAVGAPLPPC
nr:selenoprotein V-like [Aegilops tauschii subsp. strangulata]